MFWKKPSLVDPTLGKLTFALGYWSSGDVNTPAGPSIISIEGDKSSPNPGALSVAQNLALSPLDTIDQAQRYLNADSRFRDFAETNGTLVFNGFTVNAAQGSFTVNFGLSQWPDAMIEVLFEQGAPSAIELGD